jgi:hypothetical protein
MLDYIITRRSDRDDVQVTRAMCGAECWIDHRLVISRLNVHIRPKRRPQRKKTPPKRLDTAKLKKDEAVRSLVSDLNDRLVNLIFGNTSIEEEWASFGVMVYSASLENLGQLYRKHQDWFDESNEQIQIPPDEKHRLHVALQGDPNSESKGLHSKSVKREYRLHYVICRTNGSATKMTKYRYTLTATTPNDSTMP